MGAPEIRSKLLATTNLRIKPVELDLAGEKTVVWVRQPTFAERARLIEKAGLSADGTPELKKLMDAKFEAVILCVVDPDSREQIFSDLFRKELEKQDPIMIDVLGDAILALGSGSLSTKCACGSVIEPGYRFCPGCGEAAPTQVEIAEKNS